MYLLIAGICVSSARVVFYYLDGTDGKHFDMSTYPPKHFEAYVGSRKVFEFPTRAEETKTK